MYFLKRTIIISETEIKFFKNTLKREKIICALKDLRVGGKGQKKGLRKVFGGGGKHLRVKGERGGQGKRGEREERERKTDRELGEKRWKMEREREKWGETKSEKRKEI